MERRVILYILVSVFIGMTACSSAFPTKIHTILSNPRDYSNKQVTISGTVEDTFSLVVVKYFVLRDETGTMPVITQQTMPVKGIRSR